MPVFDFPVSGVIRVEASTEREANEAVNQAVGSFIKTRRAQLIKTNYTLAVLIEDFQVAGVTFSNM